MTTKTVTVTYHNMHDREPKGVRQYQIDIPSNGDLAGDRETVFRYMNHVDGSEKQLLALKERSMSVGDSVTIDGHTFLCESIGWKEIPELPVP
jgi:hypothetical protein